MKIETLVIWALLISIVGIVVILILKEADIFTSDVFSSIGSLPAKLGSGIASGFKSLFGWVGALFTTPAPAP